MMYYSILASVCLLGMASSQTIEMLTACVIKEQTLKIVCEFSPAKSSSVTRCTYMIDDKVAASTDKEVSADEMYKKQATVTIINKSCVLDLTSFQDGPSKAYNCTIVQEKTVTKTILVEKKSTKACSAGNTLKHGGVILLLAFVVPLLSGML